MQVPGDAGGLMCPCPLDTGLSLEGSFSLPLLDPTIRYLGQEDPLEEEMTPHASILAWRITWTEEPGGLESMRLQRVGYN